MRIKKEFKVNDYLSLKLEGAQTNIYVAGKRFMQCRYLVLDISIEKITSLEELDSVDKLLGMFDNKEFQIDPKTKFWANCSNLQVWYENEYDTKLINSIIGFPLLKKLTEVGDELAKKVFKKEIAKRFNKGNESVKNYLKMEGYLEYFNEKELYDLFNGIKFDSFMELMSIIYSIIDNRATQEFLEFIDSLDKKDLISLVKNPKDSNRLNFLESILQDLGDYRAWRDPSRLNLIEKILNKIGAEYFDNLMNILLDNNGYINLPVLEALTYIDCEKVKNFLNNTKHNFKFGFRGNILSDFQLILYILLSCFSPEELMTYLEENHRDDLFKIVLPEIRGFKFLKMSDQEEIDMKHFITAFLLEETGGEDYTENLEKMGPYLADIMFSEVIDKHDEINETVVRVLDYLGLQVDEELHNQLKKDIFDMDLYLDGDPYNFIRFVELTLKYLGSKDLILKLSTYQYVDTMFYPDIKEEIYPLNEIIGSVIDGLTSNDLEFYNATKSLVETILDQFSQLLTHTFGVSTDDDFIDSILYFLCPLYDNEGKKIINDHFMNMRPSQKNECQKKLLEFIDYIPDNYTKQNKHQLVTQIIDIIKKL